MPSSTPKRIRHYHLPTERCSIRLLSWRKRQFIKHIDFHCFHFLTSFLSSTHFTGELDTPFHRNPACQHHKGLRCCQITNSFSHPCLAWPRPYSKQLKIPCSLNTCVYLISTLFWLFCCLQLLMLLCSSLRPLFKHWRVWSLMTGIEIIAIDGQIPVSRPSVSLGLCTHTV